MGTILVIAEKPQMGRDIADALSRMNQTPVQRGDLCQRVGNYVVTGAQGHLFALAEPEHYGNEFSFPWRAEVLPVLPDTFVLEPNFVKERGKVINNDLTKSICARLGRLKELIKEATEVIHAGDPDREGQLIIDDILREFGFKGPVKRLWLHAQTLDGIEDAWLKMKSNRDYANLGLAAVARRESDWAIGMNSTRAFTAQWWKKGHKGVLNIGRVVTPVVGMIVQREKDIRAFQPIDHFTLKAKIQIDQHPEFQAAWVKPSGEPPEFDPSGKIVLSRAMVETIAKRCTGSKAEIIVSDKTPKKEAAPLLFSLTELQKMAAKMGYSPDDVLKAAQSLYEKHKLTSYPRTECQYAPESEHKKAAQVLQTIVANFSGSKQIQPGYDHSRKSKSWNDAKLAEHFAIIPLPTKLSVDQLSKIESDVYWLVCRQYLVQFYADYEFMATVIVAQVQDQKFKATGSVPTILGWREIYGGAVKKKVDDDEAQDDLPNVNAGDKGVANAVTVIAKKTERPKRFTAITLLEAMEKAYLFVTDPKVKAALKQVEGLGTAATRASVIAKIVTAGFATEDKAGKVISYAPTPKAMTYIECVPENLAKPDLTAWFEGKLEELSKGTLEYQKYREFLSKLVCQFISTAKDGVAYSKMPTPEQMPTAVVQAKKAAPAKRSSKSKFAK